MIDPLILIAIQGGISVARALMESGDPTPEQEAAVKAAEDAIKAIVDADLAKVAAGEKL